MKKSVLFPAVLCFLLVCSGCSGGPRKPAPETAAESVPALESSLPSLESEAPPEPQPDNSWKLGAPGDHNMDPAVLEQMHTALQSAPVYGVVTVKDGVIIDEYYRDGYDETSAFPMHSASKSFTGTLIGIAMEEGYLGSIEDPLSQYLPQVLELSDTRKQGITLRHLLTHTSGLEWYEWGGSYSNWSEFRSAENWVEYILDRNLVYEPGTVFNYSTGNTHLLSAALESAIGGNQLDYAKEKLFGPLGMEHTSWGSDPQGVTDGGNGIVMSLRDTARFGQLCLQGGVWHGEQLIPADWLTESTAAQNSGAGDSTGQYGYQWWVRSFGGYDCYYAFGAWGQYIFVVPELEMVVAIASEGPQNSYASRAYFTDYILAACTGRDTQN